jgi:transposase InsO family protein
MCYRREFCGRMDRHPYELFLQLEGIEHRKTRVKRPQSNSIVERFHRMLFDEHFRVEGRGTWFETVEEMGSRLTPTSSSTTPSVPIRAAA